MNKNETKRLVKEIIKKAQNKDRIVFVSGTFNIVHPGHLRLLRFASECGDYLVVGVLSDELTSAQLKEETRLEGVQAISWVNQAFILTVPPQDLISELKPAMVVKGKEHENQENVELKTIDSYGGKLLFGSGDTTFSSLELLRQESELINHSTIIKPSKYFNHHGINIEIFSNILERIKVLNVCVIGDIIVDEYVECDALGMSQEDPTIVVTPIVSKKFLGGAGIIAAHARSLGAEKVSLMSVIGDDEPGHYASNKLKEYGVDTTLLVDDSRPTTWKMRYRANNKTLLRVNHLRQHKLSRSQQEEIFKKIKSKLNKVDLLIFADFNYGVLPQELVEQITHECMERGIMIAADSQSSSQMGDISRFKNASLITPTEREARLALGNFEDGLVVLADKLRKKTRAQNIIITLGAEGLLVHAGLPGDNKWLTDRLDALNTSPKDTAGAGDCLLVCTAMSMVVGYTIWESVYLGSIAAACQVGRIGNIPLTAKELMIEINKTNNLI